MSGPVLDIALFARWLASGERGISSEAIVSQLTGERVGSSSFAGDDHPHDADDFRRCQLLLQQVPVAALLFRTMANRSPVWARLVAEWDTIHAAIEAEAPGYVVARRYGGGRGAPLAYRLMRRVIEDGVQCATCDGSGRAAPCPKCDGTGKRIGGRCRAGDCRRGYIDCPACRGAGFTTASAV